MAAIQARMVGSSPLARGLREVIKGVIDAHRIIPARAGFTIRKDYHGPHEQDHPRSRGVYDCVWVPVAACEGSSPLARGLPRATPRSRP